MGDYDKAPDAFVDSLPYDLRCQIISHLSQSECVELMGVCRAWYASIPQYAATLWKTLDTSLEDFNLENKRVRQCLGKHVNHLVLRDEDGRNDIKLLAVLRALEDARCHYIQSLELHKCRVTDQEAFLNALQPIASHLTKLTLNQHIQNLAFLHIFATCPSLTHFSYMSIPCGDQWRVFPAEEPVSYHLPPDVEFPKITYLCLNAVISDSRLKCIVRRCPNLKSLLISNIMMDADNLMWPSSNAIDLDAILGLCPNIEYFECNTYEPEYHKRHGLARTSNKGLKHFVTREAVGNGPTEIVSIIDKYQNTLEGLWIGKCIGYDYGRHQHPLAAAELWAPLASIHATQLASLTCIGVGCTGHTLASLIHQCIGLETVVLWGMPEISRDVLDALASLNRLVQFDLYVVDKHSMAPEDLVTFFQKCGRIQRLCFRGAAGYVTNELLRSVAKNIGPSLRELTLSSSLSSTVSEIDWFFRQLKLLTRFEIEGVMCLSKMTFAALGELPCLSSVRLYLCRTVRDDALDMLVSQSNSLQYLDVVYCNLADPEGFVENAKRKLKSGNVHVKG
ncbi:hypothetical protein BJV82DRAFT_601949 [Fennellomyces sp. T-0311]|nr:hypothetical protein BJV82DRAFT_601949 [Fennellomyces sp. T-0311]